MDYETNCEIRRAKEMKTIVHIARIPIFLLGLLMIGCVVYHPQTIDVPLISERGDLKIDAGISLLPSVHSTVSYGLTDKVAIQAFGSYGYDSRYYLQAAAGIYKETKPSRILELYGGYGYAYHDANPGSLDGNYQQIFTQLNYGIISTESSNFESGVGLKIGYFHSSLDDHNYYYPLSFTGPYDVINDHSILLEPIAFIRAGGDHLKFSLKLGGAFIYKLSNRDKYLPYMFINLGLGLHYQH